MVATWTQLPNHVRWNAFGRTRGLCSLGLQENRLVQWTGACLSVRCRLSAAGRSCTIASHSRLKRLAINAVFAYVTSCPPCDTVAECGCCGVTHAIHKVVSI